jgi:glycosyltransferase involved in cell wall biosynthesis
MPQVEARRRLGWSAAGRVVLFNAGRSPGLKRLDLAEAAARLATRQLPDLRLEVLRGDVPPESMPLLMNAADCLLLTSDREGSPNVVLEALASNLPIVSVAAGDVAERLRGVPDTRIAARDPEQLARALVELTGEPRRALNRHRAEPFFLPRIGQRLARLYREAACLAAPELRWNSTQY